MEPYFGHNPVAELGFELESWLFDGILTEAFNGGNRGLGRYRHGNRRTVPSNLRGVLVLWEYPCQSLVEDYVGFGDNGMEKRGEPKDIKALDVGWRVPITFLQRFFQDDFGQDTSSGYLHPKREVGYCFRTGRNKPDDDIHCPVISSTAENKYIPVGYHRTEAGDIIPDSALVTLCSEMVKRRLQSNMRSDVPRRWVTPFEPGGEYDGLDDMEIRGKEVIYRFGEDSSILQAGPFDDLMQLTKHCFMRGALRIPLPALTSPYNEVAIAEYFGSLDARSRDKLVSDIAENNVRLRKEKAQGIQNGIVIAAVSKGDVEMTDAPRSARLRREIGPLVPSGQMLRRPRAAARNVSVTEALLPSQPMLHEPPAALATVKAELQRLVDARSQNLVIPQQKHRQISTVPLNASEDRAPSSRAARPPPPLSEWFSNHRDPLVFLDALAKASNEPMFVEQNSNVSRDHITTRCSDKGIIARENKATEAALRRQIDEHRRAWQRLAYTKR
jgi:hypothetical protein